MRPHQRIARQERGRRSRQSALDRNSARVLAGRHSFEVRDSARALSPPAGSAQRLGVHRSFERLDQCDWTAGNRRKVDGLLTQHPCAGNAAQQPHNNGKRDKQLHEPGPSLDEHAIKPLNGSRVKRPNRARSHRLSPTERKIQVRRSRHHSRQSFLGKAFRTLAKILTNPDLSPQLSRTALGRPVVVVGCKRPPFAVHVLEHRDSPGDAMALPKAADGIPRPEDLRSPVAEHLAIELHDRADHATAVAGKIDCAITHDNLMVGRRP